MKIDIKTTCGKQTVTRDDGERIQHILSDNWDKEKIFEIDFDNILVASVSFMDQAFGKIALNYEKSSIQSKLNFKNILDYDKALLNDIFRSRFRQKELGENGVSNHS